MEHVVPPDRSLRSRQGNPFVILPFTLSRRPYAKTASILWRKANMDEHHGRDVALESRENKVFPHLNALLDADQRTVPDCGPSGVDLFLERRPWTAVGSDEQYRSVAIRGSFSEGGGKVQFQACRDNDLPVTFSSEGDDIELQAFSCHVDTETGKFIVKKRGSPHIELNLSPDAVP